MGLGITAYRNLTKIDAVFNADGEPIDPTTREPLHYEDYTQVHVNFDFPERADPLEDLAIYAYEDSMDFRAGCYGGYNGWRATLADLAGYTPTQAWQGEAEGKPFLELVNFSDCEGAIGPIVAAKLAKDFAEWDERAKAFRNPETDWFYDRYKLWRQAFEMAADGGVVKFR